MSWNNWSKPVLMEKQLSSAGGRKWFENESFCFFLKKWKQRPRIRFKQSEAIGGLCSPEVAYLLLTRQPQVRFTAFPRIPLLVLLRFVDGSNQNSGQSLDNGNRTHLVQKNLAKGYFSGGISIKVHLWETSCGGIIILLRLELINLVVVSFDNSLTHFYKLIGLSILMTIN